MDTGTQPPRSEGPWWVVKVVVPISLALISATALIAKTVIEVRGG